MTRIAPEDMTTLIQATEAKEIASSAIADLEEMTVAHLINEAANCGQTEVTCVRPISADLQTKLKGMGYTLTQPKLLAKSGDEVIISWKNAES